MTLQLSPNVSIKNKYKQCSIFIKHFEVLYRRGQDNSNRETEEEQWIKEKKNITSKCFSQCNQIGNTNSTSSHYETWRHKEADTCVDLALQPTAMQKTGQC